MVHIRFVALALCLLGASYFVNPSIAFRYELQELDKTTLVQTGVDSLLKEDRKGNLTITEVEGATWTDAGTIQSETQRTKHEWNMAQVVQTDKSNPAAGVLNVDTVASGTQFFWNKFKSVFGGPDLPKDLVLIGLHASRDPSIKAMMEKPRNQTKSNQISMSHNKESDRQFLGPGFYMLNGYSVNDNRPVTDVNFLASGLRQYAIQQSGEGFFGSVLAFVVPKEKLLGQRFAVRTATAYVDGRISNSYNTSFEDAYDNRKSQNQALPDPEAEGCEPGSACMSVWTPMWFGSPTQRGANQGGHLAEVKASAALAEVMKPFAMYKCTKKSGSKLLQFKQKLL